MNMKIPKRNFKRYIAARTTGFALLLIFLFGFFSLLYINYSGKENAKDHIEEILGNVDALFHSAVSEAESMLGLLKEDETLRLSMKEEDKKGYLKNKVYTVLGNKSSLAAIHIVRKDGGFGFSTKKLPRMYDPVKFSDWGVLKFAKERKKGEIYPNSYIWESGATNAFSVAEKIYDGEEELGTVILDFSTDYIKNILNSLDKGYLGRMRLIMIHGRAYEVYNDSPFQNRNVRVDSDFLRNGKKKTKKDYITTEFQAKGSDMKYIGILESGFIKADIRLLSVTMLAAVIPTVLFSFFIIRFLSGKLVAPIKDLTEEIKMLGEDRPELSHDERKIEEMDMIRDAFSDLLKRLSEYHKKDLEKCELLRVAEVKALQSQINPHFLYNTLDSIKWEAKLNKIEKIAKIATEFGNVLKSCMNFNETIIRVEEELNIIKSYIFIQKERYSDRFQVIFSVDEAVYHYRIPKFILQPIVENAVIHGMEEIGEKGRIEVEGKEEGEFLCFRVKDNGGGFKEEFHSLICEKENGRGIGLYNVNRRVKLYYGEEFGLTLQESEETKTCIQLKILKEPKGGSHVQDSHCGR